jgi:hypothetical protein
MRGAGLTRAEIHSEIAELTINGADIGSRRLLNDILVAGSAGGRGLWPGHDEV